MIDKLPSVLSTKGIVSKIRSGNQLEAPTKSKLDCKYCNLLFLTEGSLRKHSVKHLSLIEEMQKAEFTNELTLKLGSPFLHLNLVIDDLDLKFGFFVDREFNKKLTGANSTKMTAFERILRLFFFKSYTSYPKEQMKSAIYLILLIQLFAKEIGENKEMSKYKFPRAIPKLMNKFITEFLEETQFLKRKSRDFVFAFLEEGQRFVDWLFEINLTDNKVDLMLDHI